jgi:CHAT domain-containing protein
MVVVVFVRRCVVSLCLALAMLNVGASHAGTPPTVVNDAATTDKLNALMIEYGKQMSSGAFFAAGQVSRLMFELQSKGGGADSAMAQVYLSMWATSLMLAGDLVGAKKLYREQLATAEHGYGVDSAETLAVLQQLKSLALMQANFDEVDALTLRTMALTKKLNGDKSSQFAQQWFELGDAATVKHEATAALQAYAEGMRIIESSIASKLDPALLGPLERVAYANWTFGERAKAIELYERAWAIAQTVPTMPISERASKQLVLSDWYELSGRSDRSATVAKSALLLLETQISQLEKSPVDDAQLRILLAQAGMANLQKKGDLPRAEQQFRNEIALARKAHEHSGYVAMLAGVVRERGNPKAALDILLGEQAALGKSAATHNFDILVADLWRELRETKRAEKVLDGLRAGCGKPNAGCAVDAMSTVFLYSTIGRVPKAEQTLTAWLERAELELMQVMKAGTEADHKIYFDQYAHVLNAVLSFQYNFAPTSRAVARLAFTTLLRRKGRVLDAATIVAGTMRANAAPQDKAAIDELNSARTQLAKLAVAGDTGLGAAHYAKQVAELEASIRQLDVQLAAKNAKYRAITQAVTLADVQTAIPADARLVEISSFSPLAPQSWSVTVVPNSPHIVTQPRRYVAYVIGQRGEPSVVDLGDAMAIDQSIVRFRNAVKDPDNDSVAQLGNQLYKLTMAKIAPVLGGAADLLLAPDGALNLVPFSALVDDKGDYLIKKFNFTYLTSGRDLLRKSVPSKTKGGVVFADPAFDGGTPSTTTKSRGQRSLTMTAMHWARLPGTEKEADALDKTMSELTIYRGAAATEGQLKLLHGPRILHLATHGFFLPDQVVATTINGLAARGDSGSAVSFENPLLRSGLALAGANKLNSDDDDGVLTAFEAAGLDLSGTQLVVLSACETGLGRVSNGEGVYGLRRALVIAGAESILMSLWQVDDAATKDLMTGYYRKIGAGEPRSAALRAVQLDLSARSNYSHPYYWAAFFPTGVTTSLRK